MRGGVLPASKKTLSEAEKEKLAQELVKKYCKSSDESRRRRAIEATEMW
jgi:hypothetical protein